VRVDHDGRIFLPADLRRGLAVQSGDTLLVDITDDGMMLWTRQMAADALQRLVAGSVPAHASLVSELRVIRHAESAGTEQAQREHSTRSARGRA
jgi:bifunctional DNA-binding transcriptional regulator/antitoxin component of YhaV-PrlF toxin-antitoxin module